LIHPSVRIGRNVHIDDDVFIDEGTEIGDNTIIYGPAYIGKNNRIFPNVMIGFEPQDLKYRGERTAVRIGDNNVIREFVTIHRATGEGQETVIGNNNYIMAYAHVAHNCRIGNGIIIVNATQIAGHVEIEDYAFVSGLVGMHQFVRIGKYAMVGGMARLNRDVLPFSLVEGHPARLRGVNIVGLRRRGFSPERIRAISEAIKIIMRMDVREAVKVLSREFPDNPDIRHIVEFIEGSQRGVISRSE